MAASMHDSQSVRHGPLLLYLRILHRTRGRADMGQKAARALLSLIEGRRLLMEHMEVGTQLVVRNSTAPPRQG